jgi:hypothetical protein
MAHQWDRGVKAYSTWHGLEEIGAMQTAIEQIEHGERSGAWPTTVDFADLFAGSALIPVDRSVGRAVRASYTDHPTRIVGVVGARYHATTPERWRTLCHAAVEAGGKPTGAFSLRGGTRVVATFALEANGIETHLLLADSFDGSLRLTCGVTEVDVVCANTLSVALSSDGESMAQLRHTRSLDGKAMALQGVLKEAIQHGKSVRELVAKAQDTRLDRSQAQAMFDALFPEAPKDASKTAQTKAENARHDARLAAALPINRRGAQPGTLATLWNAATYLVDRRPDGSARELRGGADALDSMLFGARGKRVQEVQETIEVFLRDGTVKEMTVAQAVEAGALDKRQLLESMINDL